MESDTSSARRRSIDASSTYEPRIESTVVPRSATALETAFALREALRPPPLPRTNAATLELYCPFDSGLNRHVDEAEGASVAWAARVGLVETTAQRRKLERSRIARLVALVFHEAAPSVLQLAADWTTLFCLLDDRVERGDRSPLELAAYLARTLDAFRGESRPEDDAVGRAFGDLRARMLGETSPEWVARFADEIEDVFCGFSWEAINRSKGLRPSDASYRLMRVSTVGLRPQFMFGELIDGIARSEALRNCDELAELERITSRAVGWANDIFTCTKELESGEVHNLVLVMMDDEGLSLHRALERAMAAHDAEVRSFLAVRSRLDADDESVQRHVRMLESWIRGHLDWSRETGRYAAPPLV